jgi:large subunit ribosomal protein L4
VVHGPTPRDYSQRTPKKMIAAALRGALSDRARDGRVYVVEKFVDGDAPSTKTRGEVSGGGKKPYRQKGTGRARQGSTRAPQFAGGGTVHGPTPRDYTQRTPKKMKAAALRGALSDRARAGQVHVVTELVSEDKPSTKAAIKTLANVTEAKRVLLVLHRGDELAWLSARNLPNVHLIWFDQLNTYDVLVNDDVVFTKAAFDAFVAGPATGKGAKASATSSEVEGSDQ